VRTATLPQAAASAATLPTINMHEAKTQLSRLVAAAAAGQPFIIARAGRPLVKVVAIDADVPAPSKIGFLKGVFTVPDDIKGPFKDDIDEMFGLKD
jgi:prevent-host-death family protein